MEFITKQKVYVKSNNNTYKIYRNYLYSLIFFVISLILLNLLFGDKEIIIPLIKTIIISIITTSILDYILNIFKKKYNFIKIYKEDNVIELALIMALFGLNVNYYVLVGAIFISLIIEKFNRKIRLSSSLFGILFIILYRYFTNDLITPLSNFKELNYYGTISEVIIGNTYDYLISNIISIIVFIYLFSKKSIKYNIVVSYVLTMLFIMLLYGIFNGMNIWMSFFELATGELLFLSVYMLPDYQVTPTTMEGQIIYGIILGIISAILRFVIPNTSVIITMIIGELLITRYIQKISPKLKYNKKTYYFVIGLTIIISIISVIILSILR